MAMRPLFATILALLILLAPARAYSAEDDDKPAEEPHDPCACCCRPHLEHQHTSAMVLGLSLLGTGYVLTAVHASTLKDTRNRYIELIPVAGAIDGVVRDDSSVAWTTTMMFAAWSQAMGVLVLSVALGER
jgi:hypothetical protein